MRQENPSIKTPENAIDAELEKETAVDARMASLLKNESFKSPAEAQEFIKKLDEIFESEQKSAEEIEGFVKNFDNMLAEANSQIESIEKLSAGEIVDKNEMRAHIMHGLAENFEYLKPEIEGLNEQKSFSFSEMPLRLGSFVKKHKAAFVAFNVFLALAKMSGGSAEAADNPDSYLPSADNEINPTPESGEEFEDINEMLAHSIDHDAIDISDDAEDRISSIAATIEELKNNPDAMHFSVDSEAGKTDSTVNADKLIEKLKENGALRLDFKSFFSSEMSESQDVQKNNARSEVVFSVLNTPENRAAHENSTEKIFDAQGQTREEALVGALSEAAHYQNTIITSKSIDQQSEATTSSNFEYNETLKTAADEIINIEDIEISADTKKDSEGNTATTFTAKIKTRI